VAEVSGEGVPMDDPRSDDELVAACVAGDTDAFAPLVARHAPYLRAVAARVLGPGDAAIEDACQEALARAYRHLGDYRPEGCFRA